MCPFSTAASITIKNEPSLKNWLKDVYKGVMYDAIQKRRGTDFSFLGLKNLEVMIFPRCIATGLEGLLDFNKVGFPVFVEVSSSKFASLASTTSSIGQQQIVPVMDLAPKLCVLSGNGSGPEKKCGR